MTDAPKLNAYIVALNFGEGGPLYVNATLASNEAVAAAGVTTEFFQRAGGGTDRQLIGVSVAQLAPEYLRIALRAHEGALDPGKPNIVSLVQERNPGLEPTEQMRNIWSYEPHRDKPVPDGAS